MKKIIMFMLSLALLAGLVVNASALELGEPFPDFTVETIDGGTFTLSEALKDHEGVLLNLFATWCGPCQMEFPDLDEVAPLYADRVATIAVSVEPKDSADVLRSFREALEISLPMAPLGDMDLGSIVHGTPYYGIPTTVLIDRSGNMVFMQEGAFISASDVEKVYNMVLSDTTDIAGVRADHYTFRVVDQNGAGVPGAYINICTDDTCLPAPADENGVIAFEGEPQVYHLQILKVPEGYSFDPAFELYTEAEPGEYTVEITKD